MAPDGSGEPVRKVLYVDDNPANLKLVKAMLSFRPHVEVMTAAGGPDGLAMAREHRPDLVLLDLNLPGMRGDQVLVELRADPATAAIPTVVMTALDDGKVENEVLAAGAAAFLAKPFEMDHFLSLVDDLLGEGD